MNSGNGTFSQGNKLKDDNRGTTMVSIIVAFALLTLILLMVYQATKFSYNMMSESVDNQQNASERTAKFLTNDYDNSESTEIVPKSDVSFKDEKGNEIKLPLTVKESVDENGEEIMKVFE